jgi:MOSC domain-containing protein YiiM
MTGSVVQINVSRGGVPKYPIAEGQVAPLGIEGDLHAHPKFHGGPERALLLICAEVIEELAARGYPIYFGALGENLTTRGLDHRQMRAGQRYRIGELFLELTTIRVPCAALKVYGPAIKGEIYDAQVRAADPASPRWAMSGFYARVIQGGRVRLHDIIALVDQVV